MDTKLQSAACSEHAARAWRAQPEDVRAPSASGTIWYMGAKTRLLEALDAAIGPLLDAARRRASRPPVLLDMFTGTGVVAGHFADRARILAADAQRYAAVLADAELTPPGSVSPDLGARMLAGAAEAARPLVQALAEPLAEEAAFLGAAPTAALCAQYRALLEGAGPAPRLGGARRRRTIGRGRPAPDLDPEAEARALRAGGAPASLVTAYWRNVYFGIRQAIDLDSLRFAIDGIEPGPARTRALAALLYAASKSTSATAHFAQPRALGRDSEVAALLARRRIDIRRLFASRLDALEARAAARGPLAGVPRVAALPYERALGEAFASEPIDVVYADPPYTQDNYSRFYHVLEVLVAYDYPPLERRAGALTKGRYAAADRRFASAFTRLSTVEAEFARVTDLAADRGAALVWSYSTTNGILVKDVYGGDLARLRALLGRRYEHVTIAEHALRHSGAGDRNHAARELIAVCREPR